jgi:hypothetical protein
MTITPLLLLHDTVEKALDLDDLVRATAAGHGHRTGGVGTGTLIGG